MTRKLNLCIVGLMMAISFIIGTVFAPGPALSDYYGTCAGGCWTLHQDGFYGVKLDSGLKLSKVEQVSDHSVYITVVKKITG